MRPVVILAAPGDDWLPAFLTVLAEGGVAVPLSAAYPPAELVWFADDVGATTVVLGDSMAEHGAALARGRTVERLADVAARGRGRDRDPFAGAADEPALVLYTSGTTGRPKGAVLSRGNLASHTSLLRGAWGVTAADRLVHALPLHHLHGLVVALLTAYTAGARIHLLPRFDAAQVIDALVRHDASVWMAVPTMYHRLREHAERDAAARAALAGAAARLRLATSGSAALPATLAAWWAELHGAIPLERYGMTEIGIALSNPLERSGRRAGRVGAPLASVEVRLVGQASAGAGGDGGGAGGGVTDEGTAAGELWVRGPSVFAGYHGRADATAEAFSDGWFRTGDVAERGADGSYRLHGRTSVDILKSAGYKISALEIEEVLRDHPAIAEVAVVGLPDEALGDRVVAAVVARPGSTVDDDDVRGFARSRLAAYKVPRAVVRVAELPRNPLGKVQKPALIRQLIDGDEPALRSDGRRPPR